MQNLPTCRRPLLVVSPGLLITVFFFAAGICWAGFLKLPGPALFAASLLLTGFLYILHRLKPQGIRLVFHACLGILFFLLGLLHAQTFLQPPVDPHHIYNRINAKQAVSLDGILSKYPTVTNTSTGPETRFLLRAESLLAPSGKHDQPPNKIRLSGLVLLTLKGLLPKGILPGDRIMVQANLSRVYTFSTPGSFNYKKHLASQAVYVRGWVPGPGNIIKLHKPHSDLPASHLTTLRYMPERIRYQLAEFLNNSLTQPARGLYKAILIGDRNDVPAFVLDNFTGAGCVHILAISGMHMGLLALILIGTFNWLLKRSSWLMLHAPVLKIGVSLALLPLLLYAFIAGFNIPVLRALLMTIVLILAVLFDRPGNIVNHILLAALLILAWKPGALFTASFQLSFSAVFAIALIYPKLSHLLLHEPPAAAPQATNSGLSAISKTIPQVLLRWFLAAFALTTAAMLGTFPLLLFHFNRVSLVAPLSNLLVEPLICFWALTFGLVASLCIPFFPVLAKFLFLAGGHGLIAAEKICAFFAALPNSSLWLSTPSLFEVAIFYLLLISVAAALHSSGKQRRYSLIMVLFFFFSLVAAPAVTTIAKQSSRAATVSFLDVGHGSAVLLQLPDNKNILIDGGGAESERFNIGERVIGSFLWNQKIQDLDAVIITHPHADHYNGLPFILARFHPQEIWINGRQGYDQGYKELLDLAGKLNIATKTARAGDLLFQSGSTRLLCLHGSSEPGNTDNIPPARSGTLNPNDASLVLRLEINDRVFLFPADISGTLAEILARENKLIKSDVLLAPHHGSPSSMSQDFIETVAPEYIVISAGRNNPFNFPARSFSDLQDNGIEILTTGRDGTITFRVEAGQIEVSRYQVN